MIDTALLDNMRTRVQERADADRHVLEALRRSVRPLRSEVQQIRPRSATSVSLVAADGGNNAVQFDPYLFQLVRVVDSYGEELLLDVVSPTTDIEALSRHHLDERGQAHSALGIMMRDLGVRNLWQLSPMIPKPGTEKPKSSWVLVYRDLAEWAALYSILARDFPTDTLIVRDGLIRSKIFARELFIDLRKLITAAIERTYTKSRRRIWFVGVAKGSKVLARYQLAFKLEGVLTQDYPCHVRIPTALEAEAYDWPEYANRGEDESGEAPKFVGGVMYMAKFGNRSGDPIWPVDIFLPQADDTNNVATVMAHLLADTLNGFPIPLYPRCLQQAHEKAALAGFDMSLMQDMILDSIRASLKETERPVVDHVNLQTDLANLRYGG